MYLYCYPDAGFAPSVLDTAVFLIGKLSAMLHCIYCNISSDQVFCAACAPCSPGAGIVPCVMKDTELEKLVNLLG